MTSEPLYLALGVPVILNALMFLGINSRITDLKDMFRAEIGKAVAEIRAEMLQANHMIHGKIVELEARMDKQ